MNRGRKLRLYLAKWAIEASLKLIDWERRLVARTRRMAEEIEKSKGKTKPS